MITKNKIWLFSLTVMGLVLILTNSCKKSDDNKNPSTSITDKDGNVYTSVAIGTQTWMVENLKTTKLNDGTAIPNVTDATWGNLQTDAYCWYDNDITYKNPYGALYNWYAVNTGKLCPTGWHVPSDVEWTTLENYLIANGFNFDGTTTENKIAKSLSSTTLWLSSTDEGTVGNTDYPTYRNKTGFTALPGGYRDYNSAFSYVGYYGYWWSSTEYSTTYAWYRFMSYGDSRVSSLNFDKLNGFSVRCLKD